MRLLRLICVATGAAEDYFWISLDGDEESLHLSSIIAAFPELLASVAELTELTHELPHGSPVQYPRAFSSAVVQALPAMRPGHIKLPVSPKDEAAEAARAAAYERKQRWKELPGNRYTAEELRAMSERLGTLAITEAEPEVMRLD